MTEISNISQKETEIAQQQEGKNSKMVQNLVIHNIDYSYMSCYNGSHIPTLVKSNSFFTNSNNYYQ